MAWVERLDGLVAYVVGGLFTIAIFGIGLWVLLTFGGVDVGSGELVTFVAGFLVFMLVYFVSMAFVDRYIDS
jgi:hypothetical protein